jgi:hypothetical protein
MLETLLECPSFLNRHREPPLLSNREPAPATTKALVGLLAESIRRIHPCSSSPQLENCAR